MSPFSSSERGRSVPPNGHVSVGIYVRKSTDRQELSLLAQEQLIRQFLAQHAPTTRIHQTYQDIVSGKRPDRAGYQQMLADARAGKITMVVFHKVNRFGRDTAEGLAAINELRRLGIKVLIVDLPSLDIETPTGMLIFSILLSQGQFEVENLGTEARKGMEYKATQGGWPFRAPDGYINCREEYAPRKVRSWVAVDRPRAAIVRLMMRWYCSGQTTLNGVARDLNCLHELRIARGRSGCLSRHGKLWTAQMVFRVLTNRFYIGEIRIPSWEIAQVGIHPAIIRPDVFAAVQAQLHRQGILRNTRHTYLLQDRLLLADTVPPTPLYCTQIRRPEQVYRYYYVYSKGRRVYYEASAIEHQVITQIRERLAALGVHPAEAVHRRAQASIAELRQRANAKLDRLAGDRERLLYLGRTGFFHEHEVTAEMQKLTIDEQAARADLAQSERLAADYDAYIQIGMSLLSAIEHWENQEIEHQRTVITTLIEHVVLNPEGSVRHIQWQTFWDLLWFGPIG